MHKLFMMLLFSTVVGCTTSQEVDTFKQVKYAQDTCGKIETTYNVVVSYADTTYSFGMDSSTLETWKLLSDIPKVDVSTCHTKDVQVFHTIRLTYQTIYYQIVHVDSLSPIDSTMMVSWAAMWKNNGYH